MALHRTPDLAVQVFGLRDHCTDSDRDTWGDVPVAAFATRGPRSYGLAPGLLASLGDYGADLGYCAGIWTYHCRAASLWSRRARCPLVVAPHGMLDGWALRHGYWKKRLAAWIYHDRLLRSASCLRALCTGEAAAIRHYGLDNPIAVVPNGIDVPTDTPIVGDIEKPFPSDHKVLLYLGRIHPKKGLTNLLKAWATIRNSPDGGRRSEDWMLVIAGWDQGGHEAELRRQAVELDLGESVAFLGPQFGEKKAACFVHCHAFVLPSFSEGLPMTVLDAWACGKPVLMTPECNLPEGFVAGAAVRIETSPNLIAAGLRTVFEMSADERQTMGGRGLALVNERYTWPEVARQMREVFEWVLGGGPRPGCVITHQHRP